uniref:G-protein coupled receptors family 1 profile domain-containing protein n=1 Tax=Xenopus tropicalis TaxID=8364 RepID=A0A6I8QLC6_XENTR
MATLDCSSTGPRKVSHRSMATLQGSNLAEILGNSVVILAFIVDRRLRTRSNFFLLNLAICDFLVGAVSISLSIPYTLTGKWMFGKFLCKLWITFDYTTTTASAYSVVLISYDRFLSVNKAVSIMDAPTTAFS